MNNEINFDVECPKHKGKKCKFFCYTCKTPFCSDCNYSGKKSHRVVKIKKAVQSYFSFSDHFLKNSKAMKKDVESIYIKTKNSNYRITKELLKLHKEANKIIDEFFKKMHRFFHNLYELFSNENNLNKFTHFSKCEITKLNEILNDPISIEIKYIEYKEEYLMNKQYLLRDEVLLANNVNPLHINFPQETKSIAFFDDQIPLNGDPIKKTKVGTLKFFSNAPSISKDSIPDNIHTLKFSLGYNKLIEPGVIPENIKIIYFGNIESNVLVEGSLPNTVETIHFQGGFNLKLEKTLHQTTLHFYDVKNILEKGSIVEFVNSVNLHDGFENDFNDFLPKGCSILSVHNIIFPLPILHKGTVDTIFFKDRYNHKIEKNQIPNGVKTIHFHNIKKPIIKGSIPKSVENIILENGFNQPLPPFIFPNKVIRIEIGAIHSKLEKGSLPESVENLQFKKGFNQIITKDLLLNNNKLISVEFNDILKRIDLDSLPPSLKELKFVSNFSHPIPVIPENVKKLSFINIKSKLPQTIPKNVKSLTIQGMDLNFENGFLNSKLEYLTIIGNNFINSGVRPEVINQSFFNTL
ncbi:hypothetical protein ACTFIR_007012 [Dictyostelium discoideum]